jgi:hypothetical protein
MSHPIIFKAFGLIPFVESFDESISVGTFSDFNFIGVHVKCPESPSS